MRHGFTSFVRCAAALATCAVAAEAQALDALETPQAVAGACCKAVLPKAGQLLHDMKRPPPCST